MRVGSGMDKTMSRNTDAPVSKNLNDLTPMERRETLNRFEEKFQPEWMNQQHTEQGYIFPRIASKHGNPGFCNNDQNPDHEIPSDLFQLDLVLSGRRFQVMFDTLVRIKREEDLADFSDQQLKEALEMCASYRFTCFLAHIAAHREHRKWKEYQDIWMAEKRTEARKHLRSDRLLDKAAALRKDLGQITSQEIEDYILCTYASEYKKNVALVEEWDENQKIYMEMRDTLKDRGMHLQSLMKMSDDHIAPKMSDPRSIP